MRKGIRDCRFFKVDKDFIIAFPWDTNPQVGTIVRVVYCYPKNSIDAWAMIDGNDYFNQKEINYVDLPDYAAEQTNIELAKYNFPRQTFTD